MEQPLDDLTRRHLAKIVDSSDDAIVSKDLNGTILSWNAAAERMFGYTPAEAIGRSIRMIIPEDRQSEEDFVLGQIRSGHSVQNYETIRQHKNGSRLPISLTVSPIYDDHGVVIGASKIARDITERTRLAAAAQEQAAVARQLADIGVLVASSLDQKTVVQQVIDVATNVTQAEFGIFFFYDGRDEQSGESYAHTVSGAATEAFPAFLQPRVPPLFAPTFHGHDIVRLDDLTQESPFGQNPPYDGAFSGDLRVRSYLAAAVKTPSGDVVGGLFLGHSRPGVFTPQHEQLVAGVASWASVALENARLYRNAREADRLKDEFLAVLSHELRTPLNAIVGYARLLRAGVLTGEKATGGLDTLERNANALTQIVEDVLDVSRIITGKLRLDVRPVELPLVVHNAIATVQPAADAKSIRLETIIDPRVGPIAGDPERLLQVLWNLLSNAVKFTPKNGRVQVRVERVNSQVEVVVSDTGIGIRPDFLPHVFDRFRQGDAGTRRSSPGLGLGLSIVRHVVEMHGGAVQAASEGDGRGATFRVRLPLMIVHDEQMPEHREHPRAEKHERFTAMGQLKGVRAFAVDDDADALGLLRTVLEAAGADVTTMSSAQDALARIAEVKPHVLVVDLGMPEIDGFEFIARVRASDNLAVRNIPAAALTAFARSDDRTKALHGGFELHLSKPVDPAELVASVAALVRRNPKHASNVSAR